MLFRSWYWRASPARYLSRPRAVTRGLRIFYLTILVNAAIVFASRPGRVFGVLLLSTLVWAWSAKGVTGVSREAPVDPGRAQGGRD